MLCKIFPRLVDGMEDIYKKLEIMCHLEKEYWQKWIGLVGSEYTGIQATDRKKVSLRWDVLYYEVAHY